MGDREKALTLYLRLRAIFDKRQHDNVILLPARHQSPRSDASSPSLPEEHLEALSQTSDRGQSRGLEGLLKQLFEELASDE